MPRDQSVALDVKALSPCVVVLVVAAYTPFLGGGRLTDDYAHLERLIALPGLEATLMRPDAFGFYRPLTQASLALDLLAFGPSGRASRAVNLGLHAAVLVAAYVLSRLVIGPVGAGLAIMAFALTPKAHPIAVLWISARGELLMAIAVLVSASAWIVWSRGGRTAWLVAAAAAYAAAMMSKETAVLLPALLLLTPAATRPRKARAAAAATLGLAALALFALRFQAGALLPVSPDPHYTLATPVARWSRNFFNYAGRMAPAPVALLLLVGGAAYAGSRRDGIGTARPHGPAIVFGAAWAIAFLAPVLPIVARSELYLYLPVFGLCLAAAACVEPLLGDRDRRGLLVAPIAACVVGFGTYQISRSAALHRDLQFSEAFVRALRDEPALSGWTGAVAIVPADPTAERALRDAIGDYLPVVLRLALPGSGLTGTIAYDGRDMDGASRRFVCDYRDPQVTVAPAPDAPP